MKRYDEEFQAIIVGSDISAYALARELNDAYGIKPILFSRFSATVLVDSKIIDFHYADTTSDEKTIEGLLDLGAKLKAEKPNRKLFLLANSDNLIASLAMHRKQLEPFYIVPVPNLDTLGRVADKQSFDELATSVGMKVPGSFYVDFSRMTEEKLREQLPPDDFIYPLIAKPANSSEYDLLRLNHGFKKVYVIENSEQLLTLWNDLFKANFKDKFIVQKLVEGDETTLFSITAYVDRQGEVSMLSSAHVLLQEHQPASLGIPCSMITTPYPDLYEQVRLFFAELKRQGYTYLGFANFDVKRDEKTGEFYFFEVNPRIGRNHYYIQGAGINPMEYLVSDVIEENPLAPEIATKEVLYTIIPKRLLLRYILDEDLKKKIKNLYRTGAVVNPTLNKNDNSLKRRIYQYLSMLKQVKKFNTYYPHFTKSGF